MVTLARLSIVALALLARPDPATAAASTQPSFDCRKAATWSEKAICVDPVLARLDRRLARGFARALERFPAGSAQDGLLTDQLVFLTTRDWLREGVDGDPKDWLLDLMRERAEFLERIVSQPETGFAGTWGNAWGEIELRPLDDGTFRLVGGVAEPFTGRWTCEVDERGAVRNAAIVFPADADGVGRIEARIEDGVLVLDGFSGGEAVEHSYCGVLANVEAAFFPVGPVSDAGPGD